MYLVQAHADTKTTDVLIGNQKDDRSEFVPNHRMTLHKPPNLLITCQYLQFKEALNLMH